MKGRSLAEQWQISTGLRLSSLPKKLLEAEVVRSGGRTAWDPRQCKIDLPAGLLSPLVRAAALSTATAQNGLGCELRL